MVEKPLREQLATARDKVQRQLEIMNMPIGGRCDELIAALKILRRELTKELAELEEDA